MPHHSSIRVIVVDTPTDGHDQELAFWQAAIGKQMEHAEGYPEFHGARLPHEQHLGLLVHRLEQGQPRVHLDIHTDDVEAEVARLEKLGATREQQVQKAETWYVMRDPAGIPFCVVPAQPGSMDDTNAQRWD